MASQKTINISAATGDQTIFDADAATSRTDVTDYALIVSAAGTVIIKDQAGNEFGRYTFANAGDGIVRPPAGPSGKRFTAVGDLILNLSTTMSVTGDFTYNVQS